MTTSEIIGALEARFRPTGEDAQILDGRSDTKFSQKVRNLVSHRGSPSSLVGRGYAQYDAIRPAGFRITPAGRALLQSAA